MHLERSIFDEIFCYFLQTLAAVCQPVCHFYNSHCGGLTEHNVWAIEMILLNPSLVKLLSELLGFPFP